MQRKHTGVSGFAAVAAVGLVVTGMIMMSRQSDAGRDGAVVPVRAEGPSVRIGNGEARTYVLFDPVDNRTPREIGVAIDAAGLEGLPASGMVMNRLKLPANAPAPYRFVMFDWNSMGHEPPGIYDLPHFDFHFYFTPEAAVDQIVPTNPHYAHEANMLPASELVPEVYAALTPPGAHPADVAMPQMGVHWVDMRSPELQGMLGNPDAFQPFTKTFLYGSWNGEITFIEPMITLAQLQKRTDEIIPIPQPARFENAGWYPRAYRITFDAVANEYRIALTDLVWHDGEE